MDGGARGLPDLLDLAARLANDGPALGGRDQQVQVEVTIPVPGPVAVTVTLLPALKRLADQGVSLDKYRLRSHSRHKLPHLEY